MVEFRWFSHALAMLTFLAVPAERAASYDVEADSAANTVFVLLWNHASASYDSISIDGALPAFVSQATASIIPASVPANGSDLAAIEFDVAPGAALGSTGDLTITVLGSVSGQPIDVVLGADVVYGVDAVQPLLATVKATLPAPGVFYLMHLPRALTQQTVDDALLAEAERVGLAVVVEPGSALPVGGPPKASCEEEWPHIKLITMRHRA
mgnify:CR=1 FL=1